MRLSTATPKSVSHFATALLSPSTHVTMPPFRSLLVHETFPHRPSRPQSNGNGHTRLWLVMKHQTRDAIAERN